jgi:hypothetical protein
LYYFSTASGLLLILKVFFSGIVSSVMEVLSVEGQLASRSLDVQAQPRPAGPQSK